jgi:hypothetical protein
MTLNAMARSRMLGASGWAHDGRESPTRTCRVPSPPRRRTAVCPSGSAPCPPSINSSRAPPAPPSIGRLRVLHKAGPQVSPTQYSK